MPRKIVHRPSYELLLNTPLRHDCTWGVLAFMLVLCNFFVVLPRFNAIDDMVLEYYHGLPVGMDVDRDGISDNIDDSDGDGIPDLNDATPFGVKRGIEESGVYAYNTLKYSGMRLHSAAE